MKKYTWIFALFCVVALLFAGCGDSGSSSGPGGPAATYTLLKSLSDLDLDDNKLTLGTDRDGAWSAAFEGHFDVADILTLATKQRYKLDVEFTLNMAPEGDGQLEVLFLDPGEDARLQWWTPLSSYYTKNLTGTGPHSLEMILSITEVALDLTTISFSLPAEGEGVASAGQFVASNPNDFVITFTKFDISLRD